MVYNEVKKLAGKYRKELIPMLKKMGFNASITSSNTYWKNTISVTIKTVPKNFPVWSEKYSRWQLMDKAERLKKSIGNRMNVLFEDTDVEGNVKFDNNIPFIEYKGSEDAY